MSRTSAALLLGWVQACFSAASLQDVQHIIIFMQENRAYDHYFGMHQGVRGYNDRTAIQLPSGRSSFYQPTNTSDNTTYMLPFHVDTLTTSATCMDAPEMDYPIDIGMFNVSLRAREGA